MQRIWAIFKSGVDRNIIAWLMLCGIFLSIPLILPPTAQAAWPVNQSSEVLLGFEDSYASENNDITHSGVDLAAKAGMAVYAPASGTVSFVGRVPASDSSGGPTMMGVSITLDNGRVLTLMPFATTTVSEGASVEEGSILGTLAGGGDGSTVQAHIHVGLKSGGTYYDPLSLLGFAVNSAQNQTESQNFQSFGASSTASSSMENRANDADIDADEGSLAEEGFIEEVTEGDQASMATSGNQVIDGSVSSAGAMLENKAVVQEVSPKDAKGPMVALLEAFDNMVHFCSTLLAGKAASLLYAVPLGLLTLYGVCKGLVSILRHYRKGGTRVFGAPCDAQEISGKGVTKKRIERTEMKKDGAVAEKRVALPLRGW